MNGILIAVLQWLFNILWHGGHRLQLEPVPGRNSFSPVPSYMLNSSPIGERLNYFADRRIIWRFSHTRPHIEGLVGEGCGSRLVGCTPTATRERMIP